MERQEWEEDVTECADCRAVIAIEMGPSFAFGEDQVICLECAIRRGGKYDSDDDRWLVPPSVKDLEPKESQ